MVGGAPHRFVSLTLLAVCYGIASHAQETSPYLPYQFHYSIDHPEGGQSSRIEKGDGGAVTGSYQILTVDGFKRVVNYVADRGGFRAFVDSNEPGVKSGEYPAPDNTGKDGHAAPSQTAQDQPIQGYRKIEHVHDTPLYQEVPVQTPGRPLYQEFIPQEFSPLRPLLVVTNAQSDPSSFPRQGRQLGSVQTVSPVLTLKPDPRGERGLPQQEPVSEQVAHSPTLYFNTPNKEEEGGAIITKNNLNPPVKIFPPGSGIAQQGRPFQPSVPQIQTHHPKNYPVQNPVELVSVDVQPVNKRLGDLLPDFEDVHHPYEFKFNSGLHGHKQTGDSTGKVNGEYYLRGHDGQLRKVVYEADKNGFRAHVDTNEFGIISHKPNNATITRTGKLPQFATFPEPTPEKPERPLERLPRPSIYVGQDLLINRFADNGRFQDPESLQDFTPRPIPQGNQRVNEPGKFDPRREPSKPTETINDLKQRPENYDIVEPVFPQSFQRIHPASRPRQTSAPINDFEQTSSKDRSRNQQKNQFSSVSPNSQTNPGVQQSNQGQFREVQPLGVTAERPDANRQPPTPREGRNSRVFGIGNNVPSDIQRNSGNIPSTASERLRQPKTPVQRGDFRRPHHGPGFGYQFSTSHEQDVGPALPRFSRLENPPLPARPPFPRDQSSDPKRSSSPIPSAPPTEQSFNPTRSSPVPPTSPPPPPLHSLNFDVGSQVAPPTGARVPIQTGNRFTFRPPNSRAFQNDIPRGRFIEPPPVTGGNNYHPILPSNNQRNALDGADQSLRSERSRGRVVPPLATRAFGRQASPNLKTPASEALKSDLGANVTPAPIKHFGPPAATPLPSQFQGIANISEAHQTTPTPFAGENLPSTRTSNAARAGKSSPLLRMYENGVVIGGPEPQKISYDPINDNPARQGRNLIDEEQHSGYAPRNFGPVYYNTADQVNHYSNFGETSEPNRNARLLHETVTHQVEVPKVGQAVTPSSPLEPTAFSPANGADLMHFAVRKVSRRRRRKQRPSEQPAVNVTTELPEPEPISRYNSFPTPRSTSIPSHRPHSPHQRANPPPTSNTKQSRSDYNEGIPFGARLRPGPLPRPREITINSPRSTTVITASPDLNNFSSPSTPGPPLRKIVRRRRLKNRVQNNEDVYPNIPRTPAPADFGFQQGVPRVLDSHGRLPPLPSRAESSIRRRQKAVTTAPETTTVVTTADPDDSAVDLKQSTTESSSDPTSPSSSSKPHLPGLPPPPSDSPTVSLVSLIEQRSPVSQSVPAPNSYRSRKSFLNVDNESKIYTERSEDPPPGSYDYPTPRQAKHLSIPSFGSVDQTTASDQPASESPLPKIISPYKFGFDDRHDGGRIARHEEFDGSGRVTGFYTIEDPDGRRRLVKYIADENGFRAQVLTNEQGTDNQNPAQIRVYSTSPNYVPQQVDFRGVPLLE